MTRHCPHSTAFKQQVAEEFVAVKTPHALSKRHDVFSADNPDLGRQVRGRRPR